MLVNLVCDLVLKCLLFVLYAAKVLVHQGLCLCGTLDTCSLDFGAKWKCCSLVNVPFVWSRQCAFPFK